jgi:uncharacterized protein YndB with AHSA1/START domain
VNGESVEHRVWIDAPPEIVWRFFVEPHRLASWWGPADLDPRPGGALRVLMEDGPRPTIVGEFVTLAPYERIVFTFGWTATPGLPDLPPGSSIVDVALVAERGGTTVTLRHTGLPPTLVLRTDEGWARFLPRLREAVQAWEMRCDSAVG